MSDRPVRGSDRVGWALIGASTIAARYMLDALRSDRRTEVVGVASGDPARAEDFAHQHGIPTAYADIDDACSDPSVAAVYVSSVNDRHREQALAAAATGKHVLCEKPLAVTVAEAEEIVAGCQAAGVVLGVNHHLRTAPVYKTVSVLLRRRAIGEILSVRAFYGFELPSSLRTWRVSGPERGGGVALDITVHTVDLLRFLLEDDVDEVVAIASSRGFGRPGVDDTIVGALRFRSGTLATFHDSFILPYAATSLELYGTEGSLTVIDAMEDAPVATAKLRTRDGEREVEIEIREDAYAGTVRLFNDAVLGRGAPACSGADGLRSLEIATAALRAADGASQLPALYRARS